MGNTIEAVLFDLDGTLLDTAEDLSAALNQARIKRNLPAMPLKETRAAAGRGTRGLIKVGFNIGEDHTLYPEISEELLQSYADNICVKTNLFQGMDTVIRHLNDNQIAWGIVTNKPHRFTESLLAHLNLHESTPCVVSGDTLSKRKPFPDPILHACDILKKDPSKCLYVGDSEIDVVASHAAGLKVLVALYGYIFEHDDPKTWGADGYIEQPADLLAFLKPQG